MTSGTRENNPNTFYCLLYPYFDYKILLKRWIDDTNKIQLRVKGTIANPTIDSSKKQGSMTDYTTDSSEIKESRSSIKTNSNYKKAVQARRPRRIPIDEID